MKGMTAHYLLHRTYAVQPGDTIVVHAAAGVAGLVFMSMGQSIGSYDCWYSIYMKRLRQQELLGAITLWWF